jgi:hypothetical protein
MNFVIRARRTLSLGKVADIVYTALATLQMAVAVMVTLAVIGSVAIVYESAHGTAAVQRDVYRTRWFAAVLTLLGLNVLCSVTKRYPWRKHQTGFVAAHVGVLCVLAGSLLSLHFGTDGTLTLSVGESSDRFALFDESLQVLVAGHSPQVFPVAFDRSRPGPSHEYRIALPEGLTLVADDFVSERSAERRAAVKVRVESHRGGTSSFWVPWAETRAADLESADVRVAFAPPEIQLPFRVTLLESRADRYPGSTTPAAYESRLRVVGPGRPASEHRVGMNHPLQYRGYTFFLASLVESDPPRTTFTIAASPGLPLVYLGTAIVTIGVALMMFVQPSRPPRRAMRVAESQA